MSKKIAIVGGGPGGYTAAIRAARLGVDVTLVEAGELGGTCLNAGCIPTKALLHSAALYDAIRRDGPEVGIFADSVSFDWSVVMARKAAVVDRLARGVASLVNSNAIRLVRGKARLASPRSVVVNGEIIEADAIVVAVGSAPSLPSVEGADLPGVCTSDEALSFDSIPGSITVVGGGAVGVEFASIFSSFGSAVTVVELLPEILPGIDREAARVVRLSLAKRGVSFHTGARLTSIRREAGLVASLESRGDIMEVRSEKILFASGRKPSTDGLGLEEIGVETDGGRIVTDLGMETCVPGVYAVGDCAGRFMLAGVAIAEADVAARNIAGEARAEMDYGAVPLAVFSSPQAASAGMTEAEAIASGRLPKVGRFPLAANGKSVVTGDVFGMVKIIADEADGRLLGVHIVGGPASEMIAEAVRLLKSGATIEDATSTVCAHPTVSEAVAEAALAMIGA